MQYVAQPVRAFIATTKRSHDAHVRLSKAHVMSTATTACRLYTAHPLPYGLCYIPSQQDLRTTALFSLSASPNGALNTCSCVQDIQQSFPFWHKDNSSQTIYIHEKNSVSIPGVKHAPLGSNVDCGALRLLPHYIRFQLAHLHITLGTPLQQYMDARCERTRHKLTNKRSITYVYELAVTDAKVKENSACCFTQPCSEL